MMGTRLTRDREDDAPLAASKRRRVAVGRATEELIEAKGDTLVARRHDQSPPRGLLQAIVEDKIDTTFLISHRLPLEKAAEG
jgi:threonine dehydrogenase-like Zn-dependent dehydrogenase